MFVQEKHFFSGCSYYRQQTAPPSNKRMDAFTPELSGPLEMDQSLFPRIVSAAN